MSRYFSKPSKDANHDEVCRFIREHHIYVYDACGFGGGFSDAITQNREKEIGFLEIKTDSTGANFKRAQLDFAAKAPFAVGFCKSKESALEFALHPKEKGLTQAQKDKLAGLLKTEPKTTKFYANRIYKLLGMEK